MLPWILFGQLRHRADYTLPDSLNRLATTRPQFGYHHAPHNHRHHTSASTSLHSSPIAGGTAIPTFTRTPAYRTILHFHFCTTTPPRLNSAMSPSTWPLSVSSLLGNVVMSAHSRP